MARRPKTKDGVANRSNCMIDDQNLPELAVERRDALANGGFRFGNQRLLGLRQPGDDEPCPAMLESFDADERIGADDGERLGKHAPRDGKRNNLDRCDHLPGFDDFEGGSGRKRQALMNAIESPHPLGIDDHHAVLNRVQVGAAGERLLDSQALSADRLGDCERRFVFGYVARGREDPAFLEHAARMLDRMGEDGTFRFCDRNFTETHGCNAASPDGHVSCRVSERG